MESSAVLSLPPELAHHVLRHLCKWEKQQFVLVCKHTLLCGLSSIKSLVLCHKCLCATGKPQKLRTMKHCTTVTLRPRTMDELTKLATLLLVHNLHHFPAMTCLRIELLNVYDRLCDSSLILKSVVLHAKQLTQLVIEQEAQLSAKALAATAELPLLERLVARSRNGFEPGALGQLSRAVNVTSLHLEILPEVVNNNTSSSSSGSSGTQPVSPTTAATSASGGSPAKTPSELARLQAADEVGLCKLGSQLHSFTAVGFSGASSLRPVTALLAAVAGSPKPHMTQLLLGAQEVPGSTVALIASITSLAVLRLLPGCELASPLDLARLSALGALTQLEVAPCMPPAPVLAAWAKGCKHLASMSMCGQPGPLPLTPAMNSVTHLQLLSHSAGAARSRHGSSTGACGGAGGSSSSSSGSAGGAANSLAVDVGSMSITLRSPLSLSGLCSLWPGLVSLEVCGWALDTGSVVALRQLDSLSSISLQGGREAGTQLHARLLLPLLDKPGLSRLVLLDVSDLTDSWMAEALQHVTAPCCADGSIASIRELTLGAAAADAAAGAAASNARGSSSGSGSGGDSGSSSSRMLTDRGLVRLVAWPRLERLVLVNLPGVSLAGVKALVAGCSSNCLQELTVRGCPAVSAAPADSLARAATSGGGSRVVNLWVS